MTTTTETTKTETRRFAYVLTLQFQVSGGGMSHFISEASGTVDLIPTMTRNEVFQQIRSNMIAGARENGVPFRGEPTTVFFSLEPDAL